ncbi:alpha/beta fold hydrolase [Baekduia soli]|uniref:alpha/beta fold hydrolase n=1 Tax=Baekduia soli TaxID=496014 RepID=UPI0038995237
MAGVTVGGARAPAALAPGDVPPRGRPPRAPARPAAGRAAARVGSPPGFIDALDAITGHPIRDRLTAITAPTLIVWGELDALVPVSDAWLFGELIPDARVVVYEDTGHLSMLERPDAFNALVAGFLAEG